MSLLLSLFLATAPAPASIDKIQRRPGAATDVPGLVYGRLNQDIRVGRITVRPLAMVRDSRCPMGWNPRRKLFCAWQGDYVLRVRVSGMRGEQQVTTMAGLALPRGRRLELIDVQPRPPFTEGRPSTYRFGFRVR